MEAEDSGSGEADVMTTAAEFCVTTLTTQYLPDEHGSTTTTTTVLLRVIIMMEERRLLNAKRVLLEELQPYTMANWRSSCS